MYYTNSIIIGLLYNYLVPPIITQVIIMPSNYFLSVLFVTGEKTDEASHSNRRKVHRMVRNLYSVHFYILLVRCQCLSVLITLLLLTITHQALSEYFTNSNLFVRNVMIFNFFWIICYLAHISHQWELSRAAC